MNRILAWFLVALIFAMSGPLQAATMASARGFEKSLYGRSAPRADKYAYCGGDPIGGKDPSGLEDTREQRREADRFFETVRIVDALHHDVINIEFGGRILGEMFAGLRGVSGRLLVGSRGGAEASRRTLMISLRAGSGSSESEMVMVRTIERGESLESLKDELKSLTLSGDAEHAIVRLKDGSRAIVRGSYQQIDLDPEKVSKFIVHTHPYSSTYQGPSPADRNALKHFDQMSSWLMDNGLLIKFGR